MVIDFGPEANRVTNSCNVKFNEVKERIAITDINQEKFPVNANSQSEVFPESTDAETDNPGENKMRSKKKKTQNHLLD